jgi:hypothetical protein
MELFLNVFVVILRLLQLHLLLHHSGTPVPGDLVDMLGICNPFHPDLPFLDALYAASR